MSWTEVRSLNARQSLQGIRSVIGETVLSLHNRRTPFRRNESGRYDACSKGVCARPEYLRQGAVSCWGAGSPRKSARASSSDGALFLLPIVDRRGLLIVERSSRIT